MLKGTFKDNHKSELVEAVKLKSPDFKQQDFVPKREIFIATVLISVCIVTFWNT